MALERIATKILDDRIAHAAVVADECRLECTYGVDRWGVYNTNLEGFNKALSSILNGRSIQQVLQEKKEQKLRVEGSTSQLLGLELMGPGSKLFEDLGAATFTKTGGVTLVDLRSQDQKARDRDANHTIFDKDVLGHTVLEELDAWRDGQLIDMVIFRPLGASQFLTRNPFILFERFAEIYQRMSNFSFLLAEIPYGFFPFVTKWAEYAQSRGVTVTTLSSNLKPVLLEKNPDSPRVLPALPINKVARLMKKNERLFQ